MVRVSGLVVGVSGLVDLGSCCGGVENALREMKFFFAKSQKCAGREIFCMLVSRFLKFPIQNEFFGKFLAHQKPLTHIWRGFLALGNMSEETKQLQ